MAFWYKQTCACLNDFVACLNCTFILYISTSSYIKIKSNEWRFLLYIIDLCVKDNKQTFIVLKSILFPW